VPTRELAKSALLALLNGNSAKSFAESLPLPLSDGHRIFRALEKALPKAIEFRAQVQKADTSTAKSLYEWRRVRGDETPSEWARRAFNLRMQGTAADLLRELLRDLASNMLAHTKLVHQEFDSVILSCPAFMGPGVELWLKGKMEAVASLSVPLVADTKHGATLAAVS